MLKLLLGDPNARKLKRFQPIVSDINLLEEEISTFSDEALRGKTAEFRQRLGKAESPAGQRRLLDDLLPEAFAVVREAARRVLGMRHFDVQLVGQGLLEVCPSRPSRPLAPTVSCSGTAPHRWPPRPPIPLSQAI